jgi:hypothetical protein
VATGERYLAALAGVLGLVLARDSQGVLSSDDV